MGQTQSGGPLEEGAPSSEALLVHRLGAEPPDGDTSSAAAAAAASAQLFGLAAAGAPIFAASGPPRPAATTAASAAAEGFEAADEGAAAAATAAAAAATTAGAAPEADAAGEGEDAEDSRLEIHRELICCVCFDLLQKPVLLQCGHVFCFWCTYRSMNAYDVSACPLCRLPFHCLPPVCRPLYVYLHQKYPAAAARRDREVEAFERQRRLRSPSHSLIVKGPPGPLTDLLPLGSSALLLLLRQEAPDLLPVHLEVDLRVAAAACRAEAASRASASRRGPGLPPPAASAAAAVADEVTSDTDEGPLSVSPVWRRGPPRPGLRRHLGDSPAADMTGEEEERGPSLAGSELAGSDFFAVAAEAGRQATADGRAAAPAAASGGGSGGGGGGGDRQSSGEQRTEIESSEVLCPLFMSARLLGNSQLLMVLQ
ncbi:hypothetical protein Efla_004386 [Eimeria flavescens]